MKYNYHKKNRGFTLIELLVVVAIIGILAAVGVVAYSGYMAGAKNSVVKQNHKNIISAILRDVTTCEIEGQIDRFTYSSDLMV
jgi:type IV pilus assembly protein PilA|tara:strand:+ start:461 stop:709 length:249 start_codon:yes stop_codon:yes gene_type:complete